MPLYRVLQFLCVLAVGATWAAVWLVVAIGLDGSDTRGASGTAAAFAFFGTLGASWLCARAVTRARLRWWLPVVAVSCLAPVPLAYVVLWSFGAVDHRLDGPTSPAGFTAIVDVHDTGGFGADFYSDVRVVDTSGHVVASWQDRRGQYPSSGPRRLRDSMRWTSPTTLEFTTREGPEQLTVR